jgi:hypothetical protein
VAKSHFSGGAVRQCRNGKGRYATLFQRRLPCHVQRCLILSHPRQPLTPRPSRSFTTRPIRSTAHAADPGCPRTRSGLNRTTARASTPCPALGCIGTLIARSRLRQSSTAVAGSDALRRFRPRRECPVCGFPGATAKTTVARSPATACWLCADPVHLRLHQERLILADGGSLGIALAEAQDDRRRTQSPVFADLGTFHVAARRSLVSAAGCRQHRSRPTSWSCRSPPVAGRSVGRQLPETPEARWLRQLLNEVADGPAPAPGQRTGAKSEGRSTINSLWMWGAGVLPAAARRRTLPASGASIVLARGLGRAFDSTGTSPCRAMRLARCWPRQLPAAASCWFSIRCSRQCSTKTATAYRRRARSNSTARWFAPLQKALAAAAGCSACVSKHQRRTPTLAWESRPP